MADAPTEPPEVGAAVLPGAGVLPGAVQGRGMIRPGPDPARWPSLAGQCQVAGNLFGKDGFGWMSRWLATQFDRIDDVGFAREFSDHVRLPGIGTADYHHRLIRSTRGTLLGGIRFRGRDIERPFVEIVCHDFADRRALSDCVAAEWAQFRPHWARLHDLPGAVRGPGTLLDLTIHAAQCDEMAAPDNRVTLAPFDDPECAVAMVEQRYSALAEDHPELARNVHAADPEDLRAWHTDGLLHAITVGDTTVGVLAVAPGQVLWIDGHVISEEVISTTHRGHGHAAAAQAAWARRQGVDGAALLVGTIDRLNSASRRTAARAGRATVLDSVFFRLWPPFVGTIEGMVTATESHALLGAAFSPTSRVDPYPHYRALREFGPFQLPEVSLTVFTSYADCDAALRHPASASDRLKSTIAQRQMAAGQAPRPFGLAGLVDRRRTPAFLFLDPPDHTRLRTLVSKAFVPKVVNQLAPDIAALVDTLLDTVEQRGHFDAVADLAYPLAVGVICKLLGVPVEDEPQFGRASSLLAQAVDPFITATGAVPEGFQERIDAGKWLRQYFRDLIDQRRGHPSDDLISALIAVEETGDQLTEEEIISTCNLLLIAGHESTVSLIAHAVLAMLRHPDQWTALGAAPGRVSKVIEETLRYDAPAQLLGRIAAEEMMIGPTAVPRGDTMILLLAAAHRDPAANERPDQFDPDRNTIRHLGFGRGTHFCLGAPLVRLEATAALTAVAARFPTATLAGEPRYKPNVTLRGLAEVPITV